MQLADVDDKARDRTALRRRAGELTRELRGLSENEQGAGFSDADRLHYRLGQAQECLDELHRVEVFDAAAKKTTHREELREAIATGHRRHNRIEARLLRVEEAAARPLVKPAAPVVQATRRDDGASGSAMLPKVQIPTFKGDLAAFSDWRATFSALIDLPGVPAAARVVHLRAALRGAALDTVAQYGVTEQGYTDARAALDERFDRPGLATQAHWCGLHAVRPVAGDHGRGVVARSRGGTGASPARPGRGPGAIRGAGLLAGTASRQASCAACRVVCSAGSCRRGQPGHRREVGSPPQVHGGRGARAGGDDGAHQLRGAQVGAVSHGARDQRSFGDGSGWRE
jgi:hypothetical protein